MAKNVRYDPGDALSVACTHPATPASGDPVRYGMRPGVALTNEDADGLTSVDFNCVANLSVKGINNAGNSAVAGGDEIFYIDADTPKLSKDEVGGIHFGWAHGTVGSGATATIPVKVGW